MTDIKPCPFCHVAGRRRYVGIKDSECGGAPYSVECQTPHCVATGPWCDTREEAVAAWNAVAARMECWEAMKQGLLAVRKMWNERPVGATSVNIVEVATAMQSVNAALDLADAAEKGANNAT